MMTERERLVRAVERADEQRRINFVGTFWPPIARQRYADAVKALAAYDAVHEEEK